MEPTPPQRFLKVGDEVEAKVLTLDREERKMSLGMKQLMPDPWANITDRYPIGSKHTATVRNFTNFGIFVELEEGVDGLIHISDLSTRRTAASASATSNSKRILGMCLKPCSPLVPCTKAPSSALMTRAPSFHFLTAWKVSAPAVT